MTAWPVFRIIAAMNDADQRPLLGIPEMDAQHRYLYELFDRIEDGETVQSTPETAALLEEIDGYLNFHFTSEEHLIRLYKAPGFAAHETDHEQAAREFVRHVDAFERGRLCPFKLRVFLTGWLMEHSRTIDMNYARHIRDIRERHRPERNGESAEP